MTIRRDMLEAAKRAGRVLGDSRGLVVDFIVGKMNEDGGFSGRGRESDLYYTVFGIESLLALEVEFPVDMVRGYLRGWGDGGDLDLVHLACLARCWASLGEGYLSRADREGMLVRLEGFRGKDGGFRSEADSEASTVYGCFMGMGMTQDLGVELANAGDLLGCLEGLKTGDGGYANQKGMTVGMTPATAAAVTILGQLGEPVDASLGEWLLGRFHAEGGFLAMEGAPILDLLSTATALHALSSMGVGLDSIRERCLDFLDSLWSDEGGFCGHGLDDTIDCEYTFYGLLALGHLSKKEGIRHKA